ncbi:SigE family RNA polymerase sigma factor [Kitasatospora sp. NPDC088351]|uniref:SigE family RNA polymerase sigma factor n=1 Tax=unclassified Kitasatospora TaxID=2633591 RepID=UPI00342CF0DC
MREPKKAQDEDFQVFVVAVWPRLLRTAFLLTGQQQAGEDLVQSTLERAYAAWGKVRKANTPEAYVRRILVNEHARRLRRRVPEQLVTELPERAAQDGFGGLDERGVLLKALAELPPRQRQAVVLRYWEDLSESQAAAAMDCSVGTVKSHASKGIAKLRASSALTGMTQIKETV